MIRIPHPPPRATWAALVGAALAGGASAQAPDAGAAAIAPPEGPRAAQAPTPSSAQTEASPTDVEPPALLEIELDSVEIAIGRLRLVVSLDEAGADALGEALGKAVGGTTDE